jgi:hypothetical protein
LGPTIAGDRRAPEAGKDLPHKGFTGSISHAEKRAARFGDGARRPQKPWKT